MSEEMFEIIDEATGAVTGLAPRSECHGNPALLHRAVHVVVRHPDGRILLQKRSRKKDIQPGKWDTAVGGHLRPGEDFLQAAYREFSEELGIPVPENLTFLFDYGIRNQIESENVRVFACVSHGPFHIQESELDEVAFFDEESLKKRLRDGQTDDFTPVLQRELQLLFNSDNQSK